MSGQTGVRGAELVVNDGPKAVRTVLHLTGGQVLRTVARETEGGWEVRRGSDWIALPAASVERATTERELLRRAKKLSREVSKKDPVGRVAYAGWLFDEGLFAEGLEALDRVLAIDPDLEAACKLLARTNLSLALPALDDVRSFLGAAAGGGPAVREHAVQKLAAAPEIPGLREMLVTELTEGTPRRRSFATLALRRLIKGQEIRPLLERAILDASEDVRVGASLALRDVEDQAVIVPVVRALGSRNATVRKNAVTALGTMQYPGAVAPLYAHLTNLQARGAAGGAPRAHVYIGRQFAYVQDFDVEVAQNSSIADPSINVGTEGAVLEASVIGASEYVIQSERSAVRRALSSLTGASPGKHDHRLEEVVERERGRVDGERKPARTPLVAGAPRRLTLRGQEVSPCRGDTGSPPTLRLRRGGRRWGTGRRALDLLAGGFAAARCGWTGRRVAGPTLTRSRAAARGCAQVEAAPPRARTEPSAPRLASLASACGPRPPVLGPRQPAAGGVSEPKAP